MVTIVPFRIASSTSLLVAAAISIGAAPTRAGAQTVGSDRTGLAHSVPAKGSHANKLRRGSTFTPSSMCMTDEEVGNLVAAHPGARVTFVSEPPVELWYGSHTQQVFELGRPGNVDRIPIGFTCEARYAKEKTWHRCTTYGAICYGEIRFQNFDDHVPGVPAITFWSFNPTVKHYPGGGSFARVQWYSIPGKIH